MKFDLNARSLAQYQWGSLACRFSSEAPVSKRTYVEAFAALSAGAATWRTDTEFRVFAALLHELVHVGQDLSTGLGHADYLVRRQEMVNLLYEAAEYKTNGAPPRPPFGQDNLLLIRTQLRQTYYPADELPSVRREAIRALTSAEVGQDIDNKTLLDFSLQALLECDAALSVVLTMNSLRTSDEQFEIARTNLDVIDRDSLGQVYSSAASEAEAIARRHWGIEDDGVLAVLAPLFFGVLVDIALAVPPIGWIRARDMDPTEFDPAVKYVRLLVGFQRVKDDAMDVLLSALQEQRWAQVEASLLAATSFAYPSSEEVYSAWVEALAPLSADNEVARIRIEACRFRLANGFVMHTRDIDLLYRMQAPVILFEAGRGFAKSDWGTRALDRETEVRFMVELVDDLMVVELNEFMFRLGEFRCPHARADMCQAATNECLSGLTTFEQFPTSDYCRANRALKLAGVL